MCLRLTVILLAIALTAGRCDKDLPDTPPSGLKDQPLPAVEASTIDIPLSVSLDFIKNQVEAEVPRSLSATPFNEQINGGADNCDDGGVSFGWGIDRTPIALSASGNTLAMSFGVQYWVKARARPDVPILGCGPLLGASCGVDGEPRRTASLSIGLPISIAPNWALVASNANVTAAPGNRCVVTIFQKDVTDTVMSAFHRRLQDQANGFNAKLQQVGLRSKLESAWQSLQQPVNVAPETWLEVNPTELRVSPLTGDAETVRMSLGMSAAPAITIGAQPQPTQRPLPDATPAVAGRGFHLAVPVIAQTSELTNQLRRVLKLDEGGIRYPPTGKFYVKPDAVELTAYGRQVVVRIHFKGSAKGTLYLTGTPTWDGATNTLTVPDLDYTLETRNLLLKLARWTEGERFRDDVRNRLRFNLRSQVDRARTLAEQAINRRAGVVQLTGNVSALRVAGLYVHPGDATVRIVTVADGTVRADIR
jgi:hypothetical protein